MDHAWLIVRETLVLDLLPRGPEQGCPRSPKSLRPALGGGRGQSYSSHAGPFRTQCASRSRPSAGARRTQAPGSSRAQMGSRVQRPRRLYSMLATTAEPDSCLGRRRPSPGPASASRPYLISVGTSGRMSGVDSGSPWRSCWAAHAQFWGHAAPSAGRGRSCWLEVVATAGNTAALSS